MANITLLNPLDQPTGKIRVLDILKDSLRDKDFDVFRMNVAFVKFGALLKLDSEIQDWKARGGSINAVWGINHKGTSIQALLYGMKTFNDLRVLYMSQRVTFHPKMYYFEGKEKARLIVGSHNLTIGGTESNFEAGVLFDLDQSDDGTFMKSTSDTLDEVEMHSVKFGMRELINAIKDELLLDERIKSAPHATGPRTSSGTRLFPNTSQTLPLRPPSALPKAAKKAAKRAATKKAAPRRLSSFLPATQFVIQISPHHNGEVFLSKIAVTQNPTFFGFPFTGWTTPKKSSNTAYPQRDPDPKVNISVWGAAIVPIAKVSAYDLNTVYYEPKSEIRITFPQEILQATTDYSILLIKIAPVGTGLDYEMDIHTQASPQYATYLASCNQTLPSGGKPIARKMGWL